MVWTERWTTAMNSRRCDDFFYFSCKPLSLLSTRPYIFLMNFPLWIFFLCFFPVWRNNFASLLSIDSLLILMFFFFQFSRLICEANWNIDHYHRGTSTQYTNVCNEKKNSILAQIPRMCSFIYPTVNPNTHLFCRFCDFSPEINSIKST